MSRKTTDLGRLERLARLKSDLEMRRFSAFRQHVEAARARIAAIEQELQDLYVLPDGFALSQVRLANAMAQERTRALLRAEQELARMLPGYEQARAQAQREFGRAEVIASLRRQSHEQDAQDHSRKAAPDR